MDIRNLEPKELWNQFANICAIPHPSGHEEAICNYIIDFAEKNSLKWRKDLTGNIVVCKPATAGKEKSPVVILQSHVDMVPQKNSDKDFDFTKDPIQTIIEGEWVTADGTTLGADNGIGVATMMAVLGNKAIEHPALECLFTVEEETGLVGANGLANDILKGELLINLDSEDEGELYVGCAGAVNTTVAMEYKEKRTDSEYIGYNLELRGLKGGHSGIQVVMQRANANKMLTRFIREQAEQNDLRISTFSGGTLRNAIPREANATVAVPQENVAAFEASVVKFEQTAIYENEAQENAISFKAIQIARPEKVLSRKYQLRIIDALTASPNGIFRMSDAMPGLVETSTNLARVGIENGQLEALYMTRCMVDYGRIELKKMVRAVWELAGATVTEEGEYNGWAPNMESKLLQTMTDAYKDLYGKTPEIKAIHAGLECGIIGAKYQGLDMISIGPTMQFPHSPDERVNIETVKKFHDFLIFSLAKL